MAKFAITNFKGTIPIRDATKLPDGHSVLAENVEFQGSDLRMYNVRLNRGTVKNNSIVQRSSFVMNSEQMFIWREDVMATYGPIQHEEEVDNKIYIDSGWKGYPVYTTKGLGIAGNPESPYYGPPIDFRKLGVPAPESAPGVSVAEATAGNIFNVREATVLLEDGVTERTDAVVVTCGTGSTRKEHGLQTGDRVTLSGFDWPLLNTSQIVDLLSAEDGDYETEFVLRGLSWSSLYAGSPSTPESVTGGDEPQDGYNYWSTPGSGVYKQYWNDIDLEDRVYLYTYVTDQGEEGPPSDPSQVVTVGPDQCVTLTFPTANTIDGVFIDKYRIYRTIPTSTGAADYYFVDEIESSESEYIDCKKVIELAERLPSLEWIAPEEGLIGFTSLPNGVIAGFKGNSIWFSEPYQPHAWPDSYRKSVDDKIVAMAAFGQTLVVLTDDKPYIGSMTDPLSFTLTKMSTVEPCLHKRACLSIGYGVIYPSPNGLILVTPGGAENVLKSMWDDQDWRELITGWPEAFAHVHNGKYYFTLMYPDFRISRTYVFDPNKKPFDITMYREGETYTGGGVDRDEDKLFFFGYYGKPGASYVFEHDPDGAPNGVLEGNWKSGEFGMPMAVNMGAAQVFYRDYNTKLEVEFYADGIHQYTQQVTSQEPFRLPSGFLAREWSVKFNTDTEVQEIYVAETISELRGSASR